MQPNKSVEEIVKSFEEKLRSGYFHIEGTGGLKVELTKDFLRQALTSHTNTVLQGVVERVEKLKYNQPLLGTPEPTERVIIAVNKTLDEVSSLLNDQIISNEK